MIFQVNQPATKSGGNMDLNMFSSRTASNGEHIYDILPC